MCSCTSSTSKGFEASIMTTSPRQDGNFKLISDLVVVHDSTNLEYDANFKNEIYIKPEPMDMEGYTLTKEDFEALPENAVESKSAKFSVPEEFAFETDLLLKTEIKEEPAELQIKSETPEDHLQEIEILKLELKRINEEMDQMKCENEELSRNNEFLNEEIKALTKIVKVSADIVQADFKNDGIPKAEFGTKIRNLAKKFETLHSQNGHFHKSAFNLIVKKKVVLGKSSNIRRKLKNLVKDVQHMKSEVSEQSQRMYKFCDICNTFFSTRAKIILHKKQAHTQPCFVKVQKIREIDEINQPKNHLNFNNNLVNLEDKGSIDLTKKINNYLVNFDKPTQAELSLSTLRYNSRRMKILILTFEDMLRSLSNRNIIPTKTCLDSKTLVESALTLKNVIDVSLEQAKSSNVDAIKFEVSSKDHLNFCNYDISDDTFLLIWFKLKVLKCFMNYEQENSFCQFARACEATNEFLQRSSNPGDPSPKPPSTSTRSNLEHSQNQDPMLPTMVHLNDHDYF